MKVNVDRLELVTILTNNRDEHVQLHNKAIEGWRREQIENANKFIEALDKGDLTVQLRLARKPDNHTPEFDRVIGLLCMAQDDHVELDEQQYQSYVLNKWDWSDSWLFSNFKYTGVNPE